MNTFVSPSERIGYIVYHDYKIRGPHIKKMGALNYNRKDDIRVKIRLVDIKAN